MNKVERTLVLGNILIRVKWGIKIQVGNQIQTVTTVLDDGLICCVNNETNQTEGYDVELIKPYLRRYPDLSKVEAQFVSDDGYQENSIFSYKDWLIKNMYDHEGLISMGLALEAPDDMYPEVKLDLTPYLAPEIITSNPYEINPTIITAWDRDRFIPLNLPKFDWEFVDYLNNLKHD